MFEELLENMHFFFILFRSSSPNIRVPIESGYSGNDDRTTLDETAFTGME